MPCLRSRRSGRLGSGAAPAGGRWWHHFPGQGAPGWDHDQCPVTGTDREGPGAGLFKNAQHVGHLLAVARSGPPADHDSLADIGGGEPDNQPVAHAGHLLAGGVARAAGAPGGPPLARPRSGIWRGGMVALPAGDIVGDVVGVAGQRARLGRAAGRAELAGDFGVLGGELGPLAGHVVFAEDRPGRAYRLASATAGALAGVDAEHPLALTDAAGRAFTGAGLVLHAGARLGDHIRHGRLHLPRWPAWAPGGRARAGLVAGWAAC